MGEWFFQRKRVVHDIFDIWSTCSTKETLELKKKKIWYQNIGSNNPTISNNLDHLLPEGSMTTVTALNLHCLLQLNMPSRYWRRRISSSANLASPVTRNARLLVLLDMACTRSGVAVTSGHKCRHFGAIVRLQLQMSLRTMRVLMLTDLVGSVD